MKLPYVSAYAHIAEAFGPYFRKQGFELTPWAGLGYDVSLLLLFSPLPCGGILTSPETAWKRYMAYHNPKASLLTAGFTRGQHPNYLDLFQLPQNLPAFLERTYTVVEDWKPVDTMGMNMADMLLRFFQGHGQESITDAINNIYRKLHTIQRELEQDNSFFPVLVQKVWDSAYIKVNWEIFLNRWEHYYPLFDYLPFYNELEHINSMVKKISPVFQTEGPEEAVFHQLFSPFSEIKTILLKINNRYVRQELSCPDRRR